MAAFTKVQQDTLDTAFHLLAEHFSGVLISVLAEPDAGDASTEATKHYFAGGRIQAIGLAVDAQHSILRQKGHEPDEPS